LYVIIFGKKAIESLKTKISIGKYLTEINESLDGLVGSQYASGIKYLLLILSAFFVIFNVAFFLKGLIAVVLGSWVAKKSFQISAVSNVLNKIACYINRIK
jgi:hypothetical protein